MKFGFSTLFLQSNSDHIVAVILTLSTVCAKSPVRSTCHYCVVPGSRSALQFFSLCWCVSWEAAHQVSLPWVRDCRSGTKYGRPYPVAKVTRLYSTQLLLYLDAIPCICSQIDNFCPKSMRLLVQGPNRHTELTRKTAGRCGTQGRCNYEIAVHRTGLLAHTVLSSIFLIVYTV